jgi:hypothetical protein
MSAERYGKYYCFSGALFVSNKTSALVSPRNNLSCRCVASMSQVCALDLGGFRP